MEFFHLPIDRTRSGVPGRPLIARAGVAYPISDGANSMANSNGKGRRRRITSISVKAIPPDRYPQFEEDHTQRFQDMTEERRVQEMVDICAKILKESALPKEENEEKGS